MDWKGLGTEGSLGRLSGLTLLGHQIWASLCVVKSGTLIPGLRFCSVFKGCRGSFADSVSRATSCDSDPESLHGASVNCSSDKGLEQVPGRRRKDAVCGHSWRVPMTMTPADPGCVYRLLTPPGSVSCQIRTK